MNKLKSGIYFSKFIRAGPKKELHITIGYWLNIGCDWINDIVDYTKLVPSHSHSFLEKALGKKKQQ